MSHVDLFMGPFNTIWWGTPAWILALLAPAIASAQTVTSATDLASAVANAQPGTEIVVADGRYLLDGILATRAGGTETSPIVVRGASPRGAVLITDGAEEAFKLEHPHWHIRGLHIHVNGGSAHGIQLVRDGRNARIVDNAIELDSPAEGGIKGAGGPNPPQPDFAWIEGNEIWFNSPTRNDNAEGIDAVAVRGWVIRGNYIHDIQKNAVEFDGIGWGVFTKGNSIETIIEANVVADCFVAISQGGGGTGRQFFRDGDATFETRDGIIRNNMVLRSGDVAIYLNKARNTRIYNNTTWGSFTSCGDGCSSIDVRYSTSTADIRNNILDKPLSPRDGGRITEGTNLILPSSMSIAGFADPSQNDLRLIAGAAGIDQGETLTLVPHDIDGTPRPVGAYDLGAHELVAAPPPMDAGMADAASPTTDAGLASDAGPAADAGPATDAAVVDSGGTQSPNAGNAAGGRRRSSNCRCVEPSGGRGAWLLAAFFALPWVRRSSSIVR